VPGGELAPILYVAFGSNTDPERMGARCPGAVDVGEARLAGWRLSFAGHSRTWGGPVATLRSGRGSVPVALYEVSHEDLLRLDAIEGHPAVYRRARLPVGETTGLAYLLPGDFPEGSPPAAYLEAVRAGYRARGWAWPEPLETAAPAGPCSAAPHPGPTARARFRTWSAADGALGEALWGTVAVASESIRAQIASQRDFAVQCWPVFRRDDSVFVGAFGLRSRALGELELDFGVCGDTGGDGLAAELGTAVVRFAFEQRGAHTLFARHHPDDPASGRLLQRLGFRWTHDEYVPSTGLLQPCFVRLGPSLVR